MISTLRRIADHRRLAPAETRGGPVRVAATGVRPLLTEALRHHQAGRLDQAERLYRQILQIDSRHSDALHLLGVLAYQLGRNEIAAHLILQAIAQNGREPSFYSDLGNVLKKQGKLAEAITAYRRALTLRPKYAEALNNLGIALGEQGNPAEAVAAFERALALRPDYAEAHNNLGNCLRAQDQLDQAILCYRRALKHRPNYAAAYDNLGVALAAQNRLDEATASFRQALSHGPGSAETHNNLGLALAKQGKLDEAVASYHRALAARPNYPTGHNNLGAALREQGKLDDAVAAFGRALALKPDYAEAHNNLGIALAEQGKLDQAVTVYRRALEHRPDHAETHYNLGNALADLNRLDEAVASYRLSLQYRPDCADTISNLANAMKYQGKLDDAVASCELVLAQRPHGAVFLNLSELKRFTPDDPHLAAMEEMARDQEQLPADSRIALQFALGKAYDDCDDPARAFAHFSQGNALKRHEVPYDEAVTLGIIDRTRRIFSAEMMAAKGGQGDPSPQPIFIIGMPRSGSTLVEQILASHPQVFGAGESREFHHLVNNFAPGQHYLDAVTELSGPQLREFGELYLARMRPAGPAPARITDKLLINYLYAGLIHLALPGARIIHTRRDPADTCLSCFSKIFSTGQYYSYDLGELGRYYRAYQGLMDHWRSVLPAQTFIEVDYEAVVADPETQVRRLLAHCGLDWDPACLAFHQTERAVRTASAVQVRQQIYRRSIGRWRNYEPFLGPLLRELAL